MQPPSRSPGDRAWEFARLGNAGDTSFWLLVALWASFAGGYVYNLLRR